MKKRLLLASILLAGCGHEHTPPDTWNGQALTRTMTITVGNIPAPEAPPNIEFKVVGGFTQKDAAPLTIYAVKCGGKYKQIYLEGVGILQCDVEEGGVKSVAMGMGAV